jgi:hypothetical protein
MILPKKYGDPKEHSDRSTLMSKRAQQQLVEQRLTDIRNNKARKVFKWGFSDKTGWDWLDLIAKLAIPIVVLGATIGFGFLQIQLANQQHDSDQKSAVVAT